MKTNQIKGCKEVLDACARMHVIICYLEDPSGYTDKYNLLQEAKNVYKLLDKVLDKNNIV